MKALVVSVLLTYNASEYIRENLFIDIVRHGKRSLILKQEMNQ